MLSEVQVNRQLLAQALEALAAIERDLRAEDLQQALLRVVEQQVAIRLTLSTHGFSAER